MKPLGLYVHIPFCARKCPYCDFYSLVSTPDMQEAYTRAVLAHMKRMPDDLVADTLYFGGGTPILMKPELLGQIVECAQQKFHLSGEITLEANPCATTLPILEQLHACGFNRISFGMQSAVEAELRILGRQHTPEQVAQAITWAKQAGFTNLSADIMLDVPQQTRDSLDSTLDFIQALEIQHVSAYLLKIEPYTAFDCDTIRAQVPDEDLAADLYLHTVHRLASMGFAQYEISNFAKPGAESRHNLKYWHAEEYLGFGPSAHGFWQGERYDYPRDLNAYIASAGQNRLLEQRQTSTSALEEAIMLGLRLTEGVEWGSLEQRFGLDTTRMRRLASQYTQYGLMKQEHGRASLTPNGFLVSNSILAEFLSLVDGGE